jgi:hypothetical protein
MILTGENRSIRGKTCPSATSSTTNPKWTDPGSNPGLCGGRAATNRLSHGTALVLVLLVKLSAYRPDDCCVSLKQVSVRENSVRLFVLQKIV